MSDNKLEIRNFKFLMCALKILSRERTQHRMQKGDNPQGLHQILDEEEVCQVQEEEEECHL